MDHLPAVDVVGTVVDVVGTVVDVVGPPELVVVGNVDVVVGSVVVVVGSVVDVGSVVVVVGQGMKHSSYSKYVTFSLLPLAPNVTHHLTRFLYPVAPHDAEHSPKSENSEHVSANRTNTPTTSHGDGYLLSFPLIARRILMLPLKLRQTTSIYILRWTIIVKFYHNNILEIIYIQHAIIWLPSRLRNFFMRKDFYNY